MPISQDGGLILGHIIRLSSMGDGGPSLRSVRVAFIGVSEWMIEILRSAQ